MTHVPYRDLGQLYAVVSTQEVDWTLAGAASGQPMEKGERIRFLALAAPVQDPLYPNVLATAEIPNQIAADIAERNRMLDYEVPKLSPQTFTDPIARETSEWRGIIKAVGLKLD